MKNPMIKPADHIVVDSFKIAYRRSGQGEPMLLVHGITTYSFIWRRMIPLLEKEFDLITVDLLGCGDSDKPPGVDYSLEAQSRLLVKFLDQLGLEAVHFVGHDIGGGIGQILAVNHSERILSLVMINTVAYDYWPVQPITSLRVPIIRQLGMALLDVGFLRMLVSRGLYHKDRVNEELIALFNAPLKTAEGRRAFLSLASSLNNEQLMKLSDALKALALPVLIIRGEADVYLAAEISRKLKTEISRSRLETIPTGGHFIQEDEPELVANLISLFIGDHEK